MAEQIDNEAFGLIAGGGDLPVEFVLNARKYGIGKIVAVGMRDLTDPQIQANCSHYEDLKIGQLTRLIKLFKSKGVSKAVMLGIVPPKLAISDLSLDFRLLALATKIIDRRADGIFKAVCEEVAKDGIHLQDTTKYLRHLLAPENVMTKKAPDKKQMIDIGFGIEIASAIGRYDIGQTAVVYKHAVISVEGMEGTDECIRRSGKYAYNSVVVKMAKPNQDFRFDVPCVGLKTVESMLEAKAVVLAVEAGKTFILEKEKTIEFANSNGIIIVGVKKNISHEHE